MCRRKVLPKSDSDIMPSAPSKQDVELGAQGFFCDILGGIGCCKDCGLAGSEGRCLFDNSDGREPDELDTEFRVRYNYILARDAYQSAIGLEARMYWKRQIEKIEVIAGEKCVELNNRDTISLVVEDFVRAFPQRARREILGVVPEMQPDELDRAIFGLRSSGNQTMKRRDDMHRRLPRKRKE